MYKLLTIPWLILIGLAAQAQTKQMPKPYFADWKSADSLVAKGLYRSALDVAERIYAKAKAEANYPQLVKAAMQRGVYQTFIDENAYPKLIKSLQTDIAQSPEPARSVLESVLGEVYWQYYQQNRWKLMNRAKVAQNPAIPDDSAVDTWDAQRFVSATTKAYQNSLRQASLLQQTPVSSYSTVVVSLDKLDKIKATTALRPTLFDLLAHRAIVFFQNTEADLQRPVFRFDLDQSSYLDGPQAFAALSLTSQDSLSGRFLALKTYQQLIGYHLRDADPAALADVDVLRLKFVQQYSVLPEKDSLYRQTLQAEANRLAGKPAEADYLFALAEWLSNAGTANRPLNTAATPVADPAKWYKKQAADLCRDLINRYPDTVPGQNAQALLAQLTDSTLSVIVEEANEPAKPFRALVTYQNVAKLYYRLYRQAAPMGQNRESFNNNNDAFKKWLAVVSKKAASGEGTLTLPDDGDLRQHTIEMPVNGLPIGHYLLVTSSDGAFSADDKHMLFTNVTVSALGYITNSSYEKPQYSIYVVNRQSGEPLKNVAVTVYRQQDRGQWVAEKTKPLVSQNAAGLITMNKSLPAGQYFLRLVSGKDTLDTEQFYTNNFQPAQQLESQPIREIRLFTDRAIYRPGQSIYFKGLLYQGQQNEFLVVPKEKVEVVFMDTNGEQIASQELTTNEYGTFQGSFVAPIGRLTGAMTIGTELGTTSIQVEEYKRPTFEVKSPTVQGTYRLGQPVSVSAVANTFAGAVVDGASVRYRVSRQYQQPWWEWGWWRPRQPSPVAEIANGTLTTDAKGAVSLSFVAAPDRNVDPKTNPVFDFLVTFDVTDRNGETRSTTQTVRVSYSGLELALPIPAQIDNRAGQAVDIKVTNTAGEPVSVQSELIIYRLQPPVRPLRKRLWDRADQHAVSRSDYERLFPNDVYDEEDEITNWPKQEVARISNPGSLTLAQNYQAGEYMAELVATDTKTGNKATKSRYFSVLNPEKPGLSARPDAFVRVEKPDVPVGKNATFWVGSSPANGWVLMTVEEQGKTVREEWFQVGDSPRKIEIPVLPRHQIAAARRGFVVHFATIRFGRLYTQTQSIRIPITNKELTIETLTFRDKLKPGQAEEWTLRISGPEKDRVAAEMVATLYDASLDAFTQLNWPTAFYASQEEYSQGWHSQSFGTEFSWVPFWRNRTYPQRATHHYPYLSWGTFSFTGNPARPFFQSRQPNLSDAAIDGLFVDIDRKGDVISGYIRTSDDQAMPGVSIVIKGTKTGTQTDRDGRFTITTTDKKPKLVISFIGFKTREVTVTKKHQTTKLEADQVLLNEVVVVGYGVQRRQDITGAVGRVAAAPKAEAMMMDASSPNIQIRGKASINEKAVAETEPENTKPKPQAEVTPRRNFSETAFFFPQLQTDAQGRILLKFTMPEALTRWRLLAFAHTKDMKVGTIDREVVTQKELMITANAPRFLREGDTLRLTARLNNLTEKALAGTARLDLINALTGDLITSQLLGKAAIQAFSTAPKQSTALGWTLAIPTGLDVVTYRLTAQSGTFSDGEEQTIPVLPNRMLVTESLPFWVNGNETRTFKLDALANLNPELPVRHERLTVEVSANPIWSALQSVPYLMEYPYECAEQLFSRLYANSLSAHILNQKPAFRQAIDRWKTDPAKNPLEANAELKALLLENTPWLSQAKNQRERQAKLAQFFDVNRMTNEQRQALDKLLQLQTADGGFRWFAGMDANPTMTLHLLAGFGHLTKLGVRFPDELQKRIDDMLSKAVLYVDQEMIDWVNRSKKNGWIGYSGLHYLYARSFYMKQPVPDQLLKTFMPQVKANWLNESLQAQAMATLALNRLGDKATATNILASLRERATVTDEMGMYWAANGAGVRWYQAPIETQALLIEAFDDLGSDKATLDKLCNWLLRQKQTQAWPSTKATTEAIYALMLRTNDWTNPGNTVDVKVGSIALASRADKTEVLTGYQKATFSAGEIQPSMGKIEIQKKGNGPAYGALYWQHFEPLDKVAPGAAGLTVQKTLYLQKDSPAGPVISPAKSASALKPGDLIKVRLILTTDRDMEYVHLKDGRAAGFEPIATLSGYKYQNGLGYYEAPRDASTDFFIGYLTKGTHVFEYELRVSLTGDFSAGVATVQCFYAPEFNAHSTGERIKVR